MKTKPSLSLETDIQYLKGVGPKLAEVLAKREIYRVKDLIEYYPRAYEDRRAAKVIRLLKADEIVSLKAFVVKVSSINMGSSYRKMYDVLIRDSSGQIHCKFFRVPYKGYFERFQPDQEVRIVGKVILYRGKLEFHHPDIKDIEPGEELQDDLLPIYVEIEGFSSQKISKLICGIFDQLTDDEWPKEFIPDDILKQENLISRKQALKLLHYPDKDQAELFHQLKSPAHQRIIFEEFFWLELYLYAKKSDLKKQQGQILKNESEQRDLLLKSLGFELTAAQKRVVSEIIGDLKLAHPMNRLLQGDVGSGKTLVAWLSCLHAIENQTQCCLMAPTEILAEQHYLNAVKLLAPLGVRVAILSGRTKAAERKIILEKLQTGKIDLLLGTHALIEPVVKFENLSLVIIDEQHRFGVGQRGLLMQKGKQGIHPHILVMTATPIPRTLSMTVYGDLDVSIIDELPKGRTPIQTRVAFENKRDQALDFMFEQIKKGRQAYVVYPLVEESEKIDLKNAVEEFEKLQKRFPDVKIALLHGKMKPAEKEEIMSQFRNGDWQILVSTTVIEVGVDVPNANIMVIEHAERFGLSQLHQLRGRVGRGAHKSFCIMICGYAVSEEAKQRTQFMESTNDGFKIAEFDLELRGPGELMGKRQSGLGGFKMANLTRDVSLLYQAREAAQRIFISDPQLNSEKFKLIKDKLTKEHSDIFIA